MHYFYDSLTCLMSLIQLNLETAQIETIYISYKYHKRFLKIITANYYR